MAHLLVTELLGAPAVLEDLPPHRGITGIGLSDDASYAQPLARCFGYENTWFHTEPQLDIANVAPELAGRYDFLVASDVFEHVVPPVGRAFANARMLLKPGGAFVFSVPFSLADDTVEHFPELFDFRVAEEDGRWRLRNVTADGRAQVFDDLVFHGGPGTTLEMRLFSRAALLREFTAAGFAACESRPSRTCRSASSGRSPGRCRWSPAPDLVRTAVGDEQGQASRRPRRCACCASTASRSPITRMRTRSAAAPRCRRASSASTSTRWSRR